MCPQRPSSLHTIVTLRPDGSDQSDQTLTSISRRSFLASTGLLALESASAVTDYACWVGSSVRVQKHFSPRLGSKVDISQCKNLPVRPSDSILKDLLPNQGTACVSVRLDFREYPNQL